MAYEIRICARHLLGVPGTDYAGTATRLITHNSALAEGLALKTGRLLENRGKADGFSEIAPALKP
jgi:hypothetical protein